MHNLIISKQCICRENINVKRIAINQELMSCLSIHEMLDYENSRKARRCRSRYLHGFFEGR